MNPLLYWVLYWHWPNPGVHGSTIVGFLLLGVYCWKRLGYKAFLVVPVFVAMFWDSLFLIVNEARSGVFVWAWEEVALYGLVTAIYLWRGYRFPYWALPAVAAYWGLCLVDGFRYSYGFGAPASALTDLYVNSKEVFAAFGVIGATALQAHFGRLTRK